MYAFTRQNRLAAFCAPLAVAAAFAAAPAHAQLQETVQIANQFGTTFNTVDPTLKTGGSVETQYLGNYPTGSASELGLNYTATADANGFFFLHDNYCVGTCRTASTTAIAFSVTNTGTGTVNTRFDSQITPGHLARIYNGGGSAGFNFQVLKYSDGFDTLYQATGTVNGDGIQLDTGNIEFNNQQRQSGSDFDLLDWDTTNLSLNIGNIAAGQTVSIFYLVSYWSQTNDTCADVYVCGGNQVVFGDPRNNGGTNLTNLRGDLNAEAGRAVIGANYGSVFVPYAFVDSNDPFSFPNPGAGAPLTYDPLYKSRLNNVPEPATWAMMIGGFAMMGGAVRRRRVSVRFA